MRFVVVVSHWRQMNGMEKTEATFCAISSRVLLILTSPLWFVTRMPSHCCSVVSRSGLHMMSSWRRSTELAAAISRRQCHLAHVNQVCEGWHIYQTSSKLLAKFATRLTQRTNQIPAKRETHFMAFCPGLPGWAGTRKVKPIWILLKQETVSSSGIIWAVCKSAPRSRQITMPAPNQSVFLQAGCPSCSPTNSVNALKANTHEMIE